MDYFQELDITDISDLGRLIEAHRETNGHHDFMEEEAGEYAEEKNKEMIEVLNGTNALGYKDAEEKKAIEAMLALFPQYASKPDTYVMWDEAIPMLINEYRRRESRIYFQQVRRRSVEEFQKMFEANSAISQIIKEGSASPSDLIEDPEHGGYNNLLQEEDFVEDISALKGTEICVANEKPERELLRRKNMLMKMLEKTDARLAKLQQS